jgi:hypothetical protein
MAAMLGANRVSCTECASRWRGKKSEGKKENALTISGEGVVCSDLSTELGF